RLAHGDQLYGALGIARDDKAARLAQYTRNFEFFGAPVALLISIDRSLGPRQWAGLRSVIPTPMYLARGRRPDTCAHAAWARVYRTVGAFLKLPAEQMLFCAVAIGYRDPDHPANSFRSPRAPPREFCTFLGFDQPK